MSDRRSQRYSGWEGRDVQNGVKGVQGRGKDARRDRLMRKEHVGVTEPVYASECQGA